jgi:hypothetical protein
VIAIIPQTLLSINEVEMNFSVEVAGTVQKKVNAEVKKNASDKIEDMGVYRTSVLVNFAGNHGTAKDGKDAGNRVTVNIKFNTIPLPEGAARILDTLNMSIGKVSS